MIVVFIKFYFVELLRRLFFYKIEFLSIVKFGFVKLFFDFVELSALQSSILGIESACYDFTE